MIKLIVCDIEGCLTPGKCKPLNLEALATIRKYNYDSKKQTHIPPITLCTGRSLPYVEAIMQAIDGYIPAICENGAGIYDPIKDDYLLHPQITQETKKQMIDAKNIINECIINNFRAKFEWGKDFVISVNPPSDISIEEFYKIVHDNLKMHSIDLNVTHSASAVDITPKGIDKFSGLQFLLEKLQLYPEDVAGIGDARGDIPVLKKVGFSAAPNNATDEVKEIINYVSDYDNGNGVVDIIKHCIYLNQH